MNTEQGLNNISSTIPKEEGFGLFSILLALLIMIGFGVFVFFSGTWYEKSQTKLTPIVSPIPYEIVQPTILTK